MRLHLKSFNRKVFQVMARPIRLGQWVSVWTTVSKSPTYLWNTFGICIKKMLILFIYIDLYSELGLNPSWTNPLYFQDARPIATAARGNGAPADVLGGNYAGNLGGGLSPTSVAPGTPVETPQTPSVEMAVPTPAESNQSPRVPAAPAPKTRKDMGHVIPTSAFILGCVGSSSVGIHIPRCI